MSNGKKKLFIGCSGDHKPLADALCLCLEHDPYVEAVVWPYASWKPTHATLDSLLSMLDDYHFGVFLLTPDDKIIPHGTGEMIQGPRDNVVFELGLWLGRTGKDRTWYLVPSGQKHHIKVPTDLNGIMYFEYDYPDDFVSDDPHHSTAVQLQPTFQTAASKIKHSISVFQREASLKDHYTNGIGALQRQLQKQPDEQSAIKLIEEQFGRLLRERAAIAKQPIMSTLSESLIWFKSLIDGLDLSAFAVEQGQDTKEIWVFSPEPLESIPRLAHAKDLREVVRKNLLEHNAKYVYCVNSEIACEEVKKMLLEIVRGAPIDSVTSAMERTKVIVLPPEVFLSYFTVHIMSSEEIHVYQSIVKDDRDDYMIKLDPLRAKDVRRILESVMSNS